MQVKANGLIVFVPKFGIDPVYLTPPPSSTTSKAGGGGGATKKKGVVAVAEEEELFVLDEEAQAVTSRWAKRGGGGDGRGEREAMQPRGGQEGGSTGGYKGVCEAVTGRGVFGSLIHPPCSSPHAGTGQCALPSLSRVRYASPSRRA